MCNAELQRGLDRPPDALHALAMAFDTRQAALGGPAAISVHDDGDVARDRLRGVTPLRLIHGKRHGRFLQCKAKDGVQAGQIRPA
jgi:hypothetical protein